MRDIIYTMSSKGLGMTSVVDARRPPGRHHHRRRPAPQDGDDAGHPGRSPPRDVMTAHPVTIAPETLAVEALALLEQRKITSVVVIDAERRVEGVLHLHDLWRTEMV